MWFSPGQDFCTCKFFCEKNLFFKSRNQKFSIFCKKIASHYCIFPSKNPFRKGLENNTFVTRFEAIFDRARREIRWKWLINRLDISTIFANRNFYAVTIWIKIVRHQENNSFILVFHFVDEALTFENFNHSIECRQIHFSFSFSYEICFEISKSGFPNRSNIFDKNPSRPRNASISHIQNFKITRRV